MFEKRYVLISLNPKAGRSSAAERAQALRTQLLPLGFIPEILTDLDEVQRKANDLYRQGRLQALVGVGGDGTAAELTNRTLPGVPITLLPAGTANLIAKEYRLPADPVLAGQMIKAGNTVTLDAGLADGRLFLVMMTAGIDADIVDQVHKKRETAYRGSVGKSGHIGYRTYLGPVFHSIRHYSYPPMRVENGEGEPVSKPVRWAFLFNMPRYGFGAATTPGSNPEDGVLDYCGFRRRGLPAALWGVFLAALGGLHRFFPGYQFARQPRFRFVPDDECGAPIPYQLDGDPAGVLPVTVEIVPKRLTLLVPPKRSR